MGVEFTQSGNDIVTREPEEYADENQECAGCCVYTELVCPNCLIPLCLNCRAGHTEEACVENQDAD